MSRITTLKKRAARKPVFKPEPPVEDRVVRVLTPEEAILSAIFPQYRMAILKRIQHALSNGNAWTLD